MLRHPEPTKPQTLPRVKDSSLINIKLTKPFLPPMPQIILPKAGDIHRSIVDFIAKSKKGDKKTKQSLISNKKCEPIAIAEYLRKQYELMRDNSHLYLYNEAKGYYELLNDGIGPKSFDSFVRTNIPSNVKTKLSSYDICETQKWLVSDALGVKYLPDFQPRHLVAFNNGTLDFRDMRLKKHSSSNKLTIGVSASYIEDSDNYIAKTRFWRFINRLSGYDDETLNALRIVIGLSVSNIRRLKRLFYIVGVSNNGKSVLGDLILKLLPPNGCSSLEISELSDKFSRGILYGKHLNISSDENTSIWPSSSVAFLKKAVAGDYTKGENKYQPPFMFRCKALFLCLSNAMPCYTEDLDAGGAISKRLFIIPTTEIPVSDEEEDYALLEKMMCESDIIASWAIDGIADIASTGVLPKKIVDVEFKKQSFEFNNAFDAWSNACVSVHDRNAQTTSAEFLESFREYIQDYNVVYNEKAFYMKFAEKYKVYKRHNKKSYYIGLSIVKNDDYDVSC